MTRQPSIYLETLVLMHWAIEFNNNNLTKNQVLKIYLKRFSGLYVDIFGNVKHWLEKVIFPVLAKDHSHHKTLIQQQQWMNEW